MNAIDNSILNNSMQCDIDNSIERMLAEQRTAIVSQQSDRKRIGELIEECHALNKRIRALALKYQTITGKI